MADVDFGDLLDFLAGDASSRAILLYMEAVTHAPKFLSAARRAERAKPVIVVKSGRGAARAKAALSHTGALAGADVAYEAAFRRAGVLRVRELDDLFSAAEILARHPRPAGERLAILTNGGGAGVLATDHLTELGGRLANLSGSAIAALDAVLPPTWSHGNPVDIIGDADPARYQRALEAILDDPGSDAILVMNCPTALSSSTAVVEAVLTAGDGDQALGLAGENLIHQEPQLQRLCRSLERGDEITLRPAARRAPRGAVHLLALDCARARRTQVYIDDIETPCARQLDLCEQQRPIEAYRLGCTAPRRARDMAVRQRRYVLMADLAPLPGRKARQRDEVVDAGHTTPVGTARRRTMIGLVVRALEQQVECNEPPLRREPPPQPVPTILVASSAAFRLLWITSKAPA